MTPSVPDDEALLAILGRLGVDVGWQPVHRMRCVIAVENGEPPSNVARGNHHRPATIETWVDAYRQAGRAAFFPLHAGPGRPRGATLAGMLSGRLTEEVWSRETGSSLGSGFRLVDAREQDPDPGWDFEISSASGAAGGFTVDVKLHSELFREAETYVGLAPDDCIPLGIYKMLVARARQRSGGGHHVYAFLFRPGLADDLMRSLGGLSPGEREALELLFVTTAAGKNRQQRRAVATTINHHLPALLPLVDDHEFRVLSTTRASNLFLELVAHRAPMLSGRGSGFGGTINMHYSWAREMVSWTSVLDRLGRDELQPLLDDFFQGRI